MAKSSGGALDRAGFEAIKGKLTATLAAAFEAKLNEMGESAKGISWFSSCAQAFVVERRKAA